MSLISKARCVALLASGLLVGALTPSTVQGQDEKELGWFYTAELTGVWTGGNASSRALGFGAEARGVYELSEFGFRATGLTAHTGTITRVAVGTPDDFEVTKNTSSEKTAENYSLRARYDRQLTQRFFWFAGLGWERNTFAGYNGRVSAVGGAGNTWADDDQTRFKTTYGLTYSLQDDVIDDPSTPDSFAGFRIGADYRQQLTASTAFESLLAMDENFADFEDFRTNWTNSVIIDISDVLAFKAGLQLLFDNLPSLTTVPLAGSTTGEVVLAPLSKLDTQFTIALVASF